MISLLENTNKNKSIRNPLVERTLSNPINTYSCASQFESLVGWIPENSVSTNVYQNEIRAAGIKLPPLGRLTGVMHRRIIPKGMDPVDMLLNAAVPAMQKANVSCDEVDLVIFCSVSRKYLEPATAVEVASKLNIQNATCFDVSSACLGFLEAMLTADAMIACGRIKKALIVGAEISSVYIDAALKAIKGGESIEKNFAALTLGDGAIAAVMTPKVNSSDKIKLMSASRRSYPDYYKACIIKDYGSPMQTDTDDLFQGSLKYLGEVFKASMSFQKWRLEDIKLVIAHQASLKLINKGCASVGADSSITHNTLNFLGNMASVSLPYTLHDAEKKGLFPKGYKGNLLGFGSGLGICSICISR